MNIFSLLLQSGGITPSQLAAALASATQGGATNQVGQQVIDKNKVWHYIQKFNDKTIVFDKVT